VPTFGAERYCSMSSGKNFYVHYNEHKFRHYHCKIKVDSVLVQNAIPGAIAAVKDQIHKDIQVKVDEETFLPKEW